MRTAILIHLFAALLACHSEAHMRSVVPKSDELLLVKTALGIATIVQTPQAIQSAIIGDQSGFKVEYIDKAITIKPLRSGVKTNLYLMTEKARFNLRLVTLNQDQADYVVYIKEPSAKLNTKWRDFNKEVISDGLRLKINRIGQTSQGFLLIDGKFQSDYPMGIKPEDFWILQNDKPRTIDGLFLSSLSVKPKQSVSIGISISKTDLVPKAAITLRFRIYKSLSIQIPEGLVWN